jgi:hypothetical protein
LIIPRNNPGNIRKVASITWQGEQPGTAVGDFITFDTLVNGYRAMIKDFQTKINRGVDTLAKIITVWAPPSENDTAAYITVVSDNTGINKDAKLLASDVDTLGNIAYNMSFVEHGIQNDDGTLMAALKQAKNVILNIVDAVTNAAKSNPLTTLALVGLGLYFLSRD